MSKHLQRDLDHLRGQLINQFGSVEQMIQLAVRALVERRSDLADRVIESDNEVDETDVQIEEECLKILALHQPVASDMRWLVTAIKVNAELERMADLACNIAERGKPLDLFPLFQVPAELSEMVKVVTRMVRDALDACVEADAAKAKSVIQLDDEVDAYNRIVIDQLIGMMKDDVDQIEPAVHCFSASRHLERIGDLAENIAEEVVYLVDGDIIRHQHGLFVDTPST
ncbi:MAG: phosphate signaling complex protein PhoU, partial [Pirellulaceae bacterium]|nr:phosphate signaling complex protein PhoU [Pirellulaceae bacterium]